MLIQHRRHSGFALIEAMVALVVMSLGILGILGVQMRTLADTQTSVRRAQAIRLIEDLSERMKVNPNALGTIGSYVVGWGAPATAPNCKTAACNAQNFALSDIRQWKRLVQDSLPAADANVFEVADETVVNNHRQLGVMIRWRENERADGTAAENTAYKGVFAPDATGTATACAAGYSCHLQYIQLTSRCALYLMGGAASPAVYCPY